MNRTISTLALAAVLAGAGLTGCGGTASEDPPSNVQVTAAVGASAKELDPLALINSDKERDAAVAKFMSMLNELRQVPQVAPLFDLYQLPNPVVVEDDVRSAGLIEMLQAVKFTISAGTLTITNRQTGAVIFTARMNALDAGVFTGGSLPGTTTPPAPSTCTSFMYSAWGACQPDGTQTRTVTSSLPNGCTGGAPVTTQPCTAVPPVATCTSFTYSAWGTCQSNGTQTRTVVTSSPTGCTGGAPLTTQPCTYVPPVTTCTSFAYSAWGACQADGTQTRTVTSSLPNGCTGGAPVTTRACTYVPPVTTCTSFNYSAWGACQSNGTQTRTVTGSLPNGCTGGTPVTTQACTYVPPVTTCTSFTYSAWGTCQSNGTQTRTVVTSSPTGCTGGTPVTTQACTYTAPIDGAALYGTYCSKCHGSLANSDLKGRNMTLTTIKNRNMTQGLTDAQLQAIVTAVGP